MSDEKTEVTTVAVGEEFPENEVGMFEVDEKMDKQTEQLEYFRVIFRDSDEKQIGDIRIPIWASLEEVQQLAENMKTLMLNAYPAVQTVRDTQPTLPRPEGKRLIIDEELSL